MKNIPVNTPLLIGNEKKYLLKCIKTGFISSAGNYVRNLKKNLQVYWKKICNFCHKWNCALQIAYECLELKKMTKLFYHHSQ